MIYVIYFTLAGAPKTLLTPTIITYKKVSDGSDVAGPPAVTEIGGGGYRFTATPTEALFVVIDGGATLTNTFERYKVMQITANDGALDVAISGVAALVATAVWAAGTKALTDKDGFTISGTTQTLDALATLIRGADSDTLKTLSDQIDLVTTYDLLNSGLSYRGTVTAVPGVNQFTIPTLAGVGTGAFVDTASPYKAFVFRDAGGAGAAPQGETQDITAYNSATGVFTTNPFTAPGVGIGDDMIILKLAIPVVIWFPLL